MKPAKKNATCQNSVTVFALRLGRKVRLLFREASVRYEASCQTAPYIPWPRLPNLHEKSVWGSANRVVHICGCGLNSSHANDWSESPIIDVAVERKSLEK